MANVNSILKERMKKPSNTTKMAEMAKQSAAGNLTTFSGLFSVSDLSDKEKNSLGNLLQQYAESRCDIQKDLSSLIAITSEVKAINNQAALLHGERIKKAHLILKSYREGAFTAWLIATYGNRQTPYNLMQYYEFCESLPRQLRPQIEAMPRQAVYVLASRQGSIEQKRSIVENYRGETKDEMLALIRQTFPLLQQDRRKGKISPQIIRQLQRIHDQLCQNPTEFSYGEKKQARYLLSQIKELIG